MNPTPLPLRITAPRRDLAVPAVELVDVHKTYASGPSPVAALRGVSLRLPAGSLTAVMGPSGSGKSTLLNCAAGLDNPTAGHVVIGGHEIDSFSSDALTRFRRQHIGFVFQAYNLVPHLSVRDNVRLPLMLAGREPDLAWETGIVEAVGLEGLEGRLPGELSGGQAQRVAIARALVSRPTVVFADEPTGALDSRTGTQVLGVLLGTARRLGQTVVLVTHDPQVASAAERVLFLADGLVVDELTSPALDDITARMAALGR
ncbi:MAG: ABC transporter ATP-binding protein [Nocardioides sp.]